MTLKKWDGRSKYIHLSNVSKYFFEVLALYLGYPTHNIVLCVNIFTKLHLIVRFSINTLEYIVI